MKELKDQDIFIVVNEWGNFQYTNLEPNDVHDISDGAPVPDYVRKFEQDLERRPNVASDASGVLLRVLRLLFDSDRCVQVCPVFTLRSDFRSG